MDLIPKVIFEDNYLLVIDKPAGLVVNNAESVKGPTVANWARQNVEIVPDTESGEVDDFTSRHGVVHRIDKDTSGILLLAKNSDIFTALQKQFKDRVVSKSYIALVHGEITSKRGIINAPVARNPFNREHFGVFPNGREAETEYSVLKKLTKKDFGTKDLTRLFTLVDVFPHTGRTHQIRVHMKHLGFSIVSDLLYAGRKVVKEDLVWCPRIFLHAKSIGFLHPVSGKLVKFESELPEDLRMALEKLKQISALD